ncbi:transcriptional regulator [Streptomyces sp. NPDC003015]
MSREEAAPEVRQTPDVSAAVHLDDVVHQRTRLGLLVVLAEVHQADFAYLKARLQLTDGNLGKHIEILAHHNLVSVRKGYEGPRPRTWISISRAGKEALEREVNALKALLSLDAQR